jgi:FkbM family methyltransferase
MICRLQIWLGRMRNKFNKKLLIPLGYQLVKQQSYARISVTNVVSWALKNNETVICVQVGANDGVQSDPIRNLRRNPHWRTWLLEPQPAVFYRLQRNVKAEPHSVCLPFALAPSVGILEIFRVSDKLASDKWVKQHDFSLQSSFDREKLRNEIAAMAGRSSIPDSWIETIAVESIDWSTLFERKMGCLPNLVVLDTEGMDAALLRAFPFAEAHPDVVVFEHMWMGRLEYEEINALFRREGYQLWSIGDDSVALSSQIVDQMRSAIHFRSEPQ